MGYPIPLSQISREPWSLELAEQQELLASLEQLLDGRILGEGLIKNQLKQQGWYYGYSTRVTGGNLRGKVEFYPVALNFLGMSPDVTVVIHKSLPIAPALNVVDLIALSVQNAKP